MKKNVFCIVLVLVLVGKSLFSQDYQKVDRIVKEYPRSFSNPDKLIERINNDFNLNEEKVRAIFTWIALHIEYDIKSLSDAPKSISFSYRSEAEKIEKEREIFEDLAKQTMKKKKAVCQGYSTLFKYLCDKSNIECVIISGTSKTKKYDIGRMPQGSDHAWNAVKINNDWKLVDVTWGAGYVNENATKFIPEFKDFYFFLSPEMFSLKHYPEEPEWLMTNLSAEEFANLPLFYASYFESDIELIKPKNGIIKVSRNELVKIIIKNPDNGFLSFKFDNERSSIIVSPKKENDLFVYELEYKRSSNTYLTVFLNNEAFITFKIIKS